MEKRSLEGRGRVVGGAGSEGQSRWHWHGSLASVRGYDRWRDRRCPGPRAQGPFDAVAVVQRVPTYQFHGRLTAQGFGEERRRSAGRHVAQ